MKTNAVPQTAKIEWDSQVMARLMKDAKSGSVSLDKLHEMEQNHASVYATIAGAFVQSGGFFVINRAVCGKSESVARAHGCVYSGNGLVIEAVEQNASLRILIRNEVGERMSFLCTDKVAPLNKGEIPVYMNCRAWNFSGSLDGIGRDLPFAASKLVLAQQGVDDKEQEDRSFSNLVGDMAQTGLLSYINIANAAQGGGSFSRDMLDGSWIAAYEDDDVMEVQLKGAGASLTCTYSHKDDVSGLYRKAHVVDEGCYGPKTAPWSPYPGRALIQSISRSIHAERQAYVMDRKGTMPQWHPSMAFKAG